MTLGGLASPSHQVILTKLLHNMNSYFIKYNIRLIATAETRIEKYRFFKPSVPDVVVWNESEFNQYLKSPFFIMEISKGQYSFEKDIIKVNKLINKFKTIEEAFVYDYINKFFARLTKSTNYNIEFNSSYSIYFKIDLKQWLKFSTTLITLE